MKHTICMVCHYEEHKCIKLQQLKNLLERQININTPVKNKKFYNWGNITKCKYGMSCNKITSKEREFKRYTSDIDELLSIYLENSLDERLYHEILRYLQGDFAIVYCQFERDYQKKILQRK